MYSSDTFKQIAADACAMELPEGRDFKLLQITDMHLGFGLFSHKKDTRALDAVRKGIEENRPDLIVITGDSVFPFFPKAGTLNNKRQMETLLRFLDQFETPYAFIMGNHDTEMGSRLNRQQLGELMKTGRYSIFMEGPEDIFGVGNYCIDLTRGGVPQTTLVLLDSNMYGGGWFYGGFDCIHPDQTEWAMKALDARKKKNPELNAMAFFHMPLREFKEAYTELKMGYRGPIYHFGSIGEEEDYFGISKFDSDFFSRALEQGSIRAMFCGHDHYNTLSLTYKGIRMTYGMSIDCLGYKGIYEHEIQRGTTLITISPDNSFSVEPKPYTRVVTERVRGIKKEN